MIVFIFLTTISSSDVFADKNHVAPRLSQVNVSGLKKLLRSEIFISEDRQLQAAHLILDYELRAGDPRLARIDISKLGFLSRRDLLPIELPIQHAPREVAALREETAFTPLSFGAEINQFRLEEEAEAPKRSVELLNSEATLDRFSVSHSS